jgi:hypothetical protein
MIRKESFRSAEPAVLKGDAAGDFRGDSISRSWKRFFIASLIVGAILRLSFGGDIEFKFDEWFMFNQTQMVGAGKPLPALGMISGVGIRNPPMSIWIFVGLKRVFFASTPPELARAVQVLNIAALAALLAFACRRVESHSRECWLWAFALACVNPWTVLLQRKIWAQSTLPVFCVLFLWAWSKRDRRGWAFLWGLLGMWLGQIHMSGFIFAAAVAMWTAASQLLQPGNRKAAWVFWLLGCGVGLTTMIPWLAYCVHVHRDHPFGGTISSWFAASKSHGDFWRLWLSNPLGLGLWYNLGEGEFCQYLKYPLVAGHATYLMALAHLVILVLAGTAAVRYFRKPPSWRRAIRGMPGSDSHLLLAAAFVGYGVLLTLSVDMIPPHYLAITFPLDWLWWVFVFKGAFTAPVMRRMLVGVWFCQLILAVGVLGYIHVNQGAKNGDYGVGYQYQNPVFSAEGK